MRRHLKMILMIAALIAGFAIAARGNGSFELELLRADMKEAGPQFEAALAQYPDASSKVYMLYGHTPELREVFQKFGHNQIVPIINKCFERGDRLLELSAKFDGLLSSLIAGKASNMAVTPAECGWRAILLTRAAGNSFLGQYVVDASGEAHLLPGSSILAMIKRLTTGGLGLVEGRLVLGEHPTLKEWGSAVIDVAVAGLAAKTVATAIKGGAARAARPTFGQKLGSAQKGIVGFTAAYAPTIVKYGSVAGAAYLILHHPRVISGAADIIADTLGVAPVLVKTIVWGAILFLPLWILIAALTLLRAALRSITSLFQLVPYWPRAESNAA
jgi:hypothetical protein